ncbi:MAG: glycosyltransferase [Gemmataceae bacterium]|nr:glycosyltransferase [Gemmataceae bacterium]
MSLSVCFLTRDEEQNLSRALASVADVADEVIVADTGSADRTVEVAASLAAKVVQVEWDDDFAAGRNVALATARGDWILWLNPDEELSPEARIHVADYLGRKDALGYMIHVWEMPRANQPKFGVDTLQLRLFRRRPEIRFTGRLHPSFAFSFGGLAQQFGQQLFLAENITVWRHAYLSKLTEPKLRWAARLLEKELQDRPGQLHYVIEFGRTLLQLNDPRGHAVMAEATELLIPVQDAPVPPSATVGSLLEYLLTVSREQSQSRLTREQARALALRWFPNTPPVVWSVAQHAYQSEDYVLAARLLEHLLELGKNASYDRSAAFDPDILGDAVLVNLGKCYLRLGRLDRAESCFRQALENSSYHAEAAQYLSQLRSLQRPKE